VSIVLWYNTAMVAQYYKYKPCQMIWSDVLGADLQNAWPPGMGHGQNGAEIQVMGEEGNLDFTQL
jgi:hypothetical protein